MSKVVAFVGETFTKKNELYYTTPTSAAFLQDCFGEDNVKVCSPVNYKHSDEDVLGKASTKVKADYFYEPPLPPNCSTKDLYKKALFKRGFLRNFINFCDEVIKDNPDAIFWARTPSPGSIIFAMRVMRAGKPLLHHICGDARHTWKDDKYKGVNKLLALAFSFVVRLQINSICRYKNVVNLTSGSELESWAKAHAPTRTYQFVDMMTKRTPTNVEKNTSLKNLLFVGRVVKDKGIFEILSALEEHLHLQLTIVGEGPDLMAVKSYVKKNSSLKNRVRFEGQVPFESLPSYFESHDCVVIASKTNEGFPRVIMESWVHQTPLIVSQVGGISAFVKHEYNAFVIKPGSVSSLSSAFEYMSEPGNFSRIQKGVTEMVPCSLQSYWLDKIKQIVTLHFKAV